MRRVARFLIRLYPGGWRARYGEEFAALVEDGPVSFGGLFDLVKGAVKMQMSIPSFPKLALALGIGGFVAGYGISFLYTPQYESSAVIAIKGQQASTVAAEISATQEVLTRTSLAGIMQDLRLDLYPEERLYTPLEDVVEKMRQSIHITPVGGGADRLYVPLQIRFRYRNAKKTQQVVQTLITKVMERSLTRQHEAASIDKRLSSDQVGRLEARIAVLEKRLGIPASASMPVDGPSMASGGIQMEVIDPPSFPEMPSYPGRVGFGWGGFSVGIVLALVIAVFRRRPPPVPFPAQPV